MANKCFNTKNMSAIQKITRQLMSVQGTYGNIEKISTRRNGFSCIMNITPSENSDTYKVEISYTYGSYPKAKLLSHKLEMRDGKYPHHIFGHDKNGHAKLCVFYAGNDEWNDDMLISKSFIPWVSTWLNTYEFWLITGEWHYDEIIIGEEKTARDGDEFDIKNQTTN